MGWRSKLVFLMIIYFAGFATAIYYLAPSDAQAGSYDNDYYYGSKSDEVPKKAGVMDKLCEKAFDKVGANFSGMEAGDFKEKFNLGLQKLIEMSNNPQGSQNK